MGKRRNHSVPQGRRGKKARRLAHKIERRHIEKSQELNAQRREAKQKILKVVKQSLDGLAVSKPLPACSHPKGFNWQTVTTPQEGELRCSERGLFVGFNDGVERVIPWRALRKHDIYAIANRDWIPNQPKSHLHFLAECAE
jgi:hypothetical protein